MGTLEETIVDMRMLWASMGTVARTVKEKRFLMYARTII